ncbi:hypothetical protein Pla163_29730 [Planctomycetes bacterium Pla163]|uniref:DUF1570 domain-containing protein n=1 Tax=Rohdeia mirabilis TaxID=2528008 RepID=A0A518D2X5_9BACT|nr:hypothetical protein Pla163_29730 [Planctomycetes bacterium Pla163]
MAPGGGVGWSRLVCAAAVLLAGGLVDPPRLDFETSSLGSQWSAAGDIGATRGALPQLATGTADDRPEGFGVHLTSKSGGGLLFTKPGVVTEDWSGFEEVSLWIWRSAERAERGPTSIELQVLERPVEGRGRARFWRRIDLDHSGWQHFRFDLAHLAWEQTRIPRWDRVQHVGIHLRDADDLWIDELRVHDDPDGAGPYLAADEVARIAFGERGSEVGDAEQSPVRMLARDGIELFTDAADLDLERLFARLVDAAALLDPLLPEGGDERRAPRLVVFADDAGYRAFAPRLAEVFGRGADAPSSGGYTLLAIAHGAWDDGYGSDRPTFVHEFVHSYLSCRALLPNRTEWLQEGLATHVQMHMHPQAGLDELVTNAAAKIADTTLLEEVTSGERIGAHRYWLAMTLVETLMEHERYADRFPALIEAAREAGSTALGPLLEDVYGSSYDELLVEWRAWCEGAYPVAPQDDPDDGRR